MCRGILTKTIPSSLAWDKCCLREHRWNELIEGRKKSPNLNICCQFQKPYPYKKKGLKIHKHKYFLGNLISYEHKIFWFETDPNLDRRSKNMPGIQIRFFLRNVAHLTNNVRQQIRQQIVSKYCCLTNCNNSAANFAKRLGSIQSFKL